MRWGVAWAAGAVLRGAPGRLEGGLVSRAGAGKDLRIKAACHSALEGGLEEGLWVEQGDDITIDVAYLSALKGRIVEGLLVAQEASTHLRMDVAYPVLPQRTVRGGPVGGAGTFPQWRFLCWPPELVWVSMPCMYMGSSHIGTFAAGFWLDSAEPCCSCPSSFNLTVMDIHHCPLTSVSHCCSLSALSLSLTA
eukprot:scaffold129891_cov20-Tisochrysis_lutea.AAC.1